MAIWGDDKKNNQQAEQIAAGVSSVIAASLKEVMTPLFAELTQTVHDSIVSVMSEQAEMMIKAGESFSKASNEVAKNIEELNRLSGTVEKQLAEVAGSLKKQEELAVALGEVQKEQSNTQKSLTEECQTVFAGVKETEIKLASMYEDIAKGATAVVGRQERSLSEQKKYLETALEELKTLEKQRTENFEKCVKSLETNYDKVFKTLETSTTAVSEYSEVLEKTSATMQKGFEGYKADIEKNLQGFTAGMQDSVNGTFELMDKHMAAIAQTLSKTAEDIAAAATKIK